MFKSIIKTIKIFSKLLLLSIVVFIFFPVAGMAIVKKKWQERKLNSVKSSSDMLDEQIAVSEIGSNDMRFEDDGTIIQHKTIMRTKYNHRSENG